MMDFNPVPLPLSLRAELAKQRSRRLQPVKERPARKDDDVGHDPDTPGEAGLEPNNKTGGEVLR